MCRDPQSYKNVRICSRKAHPPRCERPNPAVVPPLRHRDVPEKSRRTTAPRARCPAARGVQKDVLVWLRAAAGWTNGTVPSSTYGLIGIRWLGVRTLDWQGLESSSDDANSKLTTR